MLNVLPKISVSNSKFIYVGFFSSFYVKQHTHTRKTNTHTNTYTHTDLMNEVTMLSVLYSQNTAVFNTLTNTDMYIRKEKQNKFPEFVGRKCSIYIYIYIHSEAYIQ